MARDNPRWGSERIRGELLKLGLVVPKRSIQRYRRRGPAHPSSQTWRTFLGNHAHHAAVKQERQVLAGCLLPERVIAFVIRVKSLSAWIELADPLQAELLGAALDFDAGHFAQLRLDHPE